MKLADLSQSSGYYYGKGIKTIIIHNKILKKEKVKAGVDCHIICQCSYLKCIFAKTNSSRFELCNGKRCWWHSVRVKEMYKASTTIVHNSVHTEIRWMDLKWMLEWRSLRMLKRGLYFLMPIYVNIFSSPEKTSCHECDL